MGERGSCCAGELNEGKRPGEGACMGRGRAPGAREPSWVGPSRAGLGGAGLGRTTGQNPMARTTTDWNSNRGTRLSKTCD
jgi:hypothetical protein